MVAMLLIIALIISILAVLLWKWLDISSVDSLKKIIEDVVIAREKHLLSSLFRVTFFALTGIFIGYLNCFNTTTIHSRTAYYITTI
ncbi:unnamed protein product [Toxocara canis]|uniref:Mechanosensitive ion channel family protein n=1 Tax=Toxocara canis TaxID=6265 RepID=A0A183UZ97_TOXCA|nr:unnamed protein product [Toxocara canis]